MVVRVSPGSAPSTVDPFRDDTGGLPGGRVLPFRVIAIAAPQPEREPLLWGPGSPRFCCVPLAIRRAIRVGRR
eukprot:11176507-Lingulodinium_polyedra.AAC.1